MAKYQVVRKHEIHCGHRVYQHESKCRNLHGHSYVFHLKCSSDKLDSLGRVIDFSVIKELLCQWLDDNWDHKMILWDQDPLFTELLKLDSSVVSIPYNPTAENLARYLVETVGPRLFAPLPITLSEVTLEETSKCSASYAISN
ncbi:MAG: 6-carboxytetrahydropterin synthase [Burkholderiales bacterium]|nr:6-carboxytetrahydropterin synthase [Burkholderiales bacterium]NDH68812.1 6-carboxytetrahydropterin synthase [Gammaproteobacteria bacterium]